MIIADPSKMLRHPDRRRDRAVLAGDDNRADRPTRDAFTMIELLIATVLGAMLLTATVQIVGAATAMRRRVESQAAAAVDPQPLLRLIRRDVTNATSFTAGVDQVSLSGYLQIDPDSGQPLLRPASVTYQVRLVAGRRVLYRIQSAGEVTAEPLWVDCGPFVAGTSQLGDTSMPTTLQIILTDAAGRALIDEEIVHHSEGL